MAVEPRTRVEIVIPVPRLRFAYARVVMDLQEILGRIHGSSTKTSTFEGKFYDAHARCLVADRVVVVYSDFNLDLTNQAHRTGLVNFLEILKTYLHSQLPEEIEFWIIFHPIERVL